MKAQSLIELLSSQSVGPDLTRLDHPIALSVMPADKALCCQPDLKRLNAEENGPFQFLDLPVELRDIVYRFYADGCPLELAYPITDIACNETRQKRTPKLRRHALTYTNRRIHAEYQAAQRRLGNGIVHAFAFDILDSDTKWLRVLNVDHFETIPQARRIQIYLDIRDEECRKLDHSSCFKRGLPNAGTVPDEGQYVEQATTTEDQRRARIRQEIVWIVKELTKETTNVINPMGDRAAYDQFWLDLHLHLKRPWHLVEKSRDAYVSSVERVLKLAVRFERLQHLEFCFRACPAEGSKTALRYVMDFIDETIEARRSQSAIGLLSVSWHNREDPSCLPDTWHRVSSEVDGWESELVKETDDEDEESFRMTSTFWHEELPDKVDAMAQLREQSEEWVKESKEQRKEYWALRKQIEPEISNHWKERAFW